MDEDIFDLLGDVERTMQELREEDVKVPIVVSPAAQIALYLEKRGTTLPGNLEKGLYLSYIFHDIPDELKKALMDGKVSLESLSISSSVRHLGITEKELVTLQPQKIFDRVATARDLLRPFNSVRMGDDYGIPDQEKLILAMHLMNSHGFDPDRIHSTLDIVAGFARGSSGGNFNSLMKDRFGIEDDMMSSVEGFRAYKGRLDDTLERLLPQLDGENHLTPEIRRAVFDRTGLIMHENLIIDKRNISDILSDPKMLYRQAYRAGEREIRNNSMAVFVDDFVEDGKRFLRGNPVKVGPTADTRALLELGGSSTIIVQKSHLRAAVRIEGEDLYMPGDIVEVVDGSRYHFTSTGSRGRVVSYDGDDNVEAIFFRLGQENCSERQYGVHSRDLRIVEGIDRSEFQPDPKEISQVREIICSFQDRIHGIEDPKLRLEAVIREAEGYGIRKEVLSEYARLKFNRSISKEAMHALGIPLSSHITRLESTEDIETNVHKIMKAISMKSGLYCSVEDISSARDYEQWKNNLPRRLIEGYRLVPDVKLKEGDDAILLEDYASDSTIKAMTRGSIDEDGIFDYPEGDERIPSQLLMKILDVDDDIEEGDIVTVRPGRSRSGYNQKRDKAIPQGTRGTVIEEHVFAEGGPIYLVYFPEMKKRLPELSGLNHREEYVGKVAAYKGKELKLAHESIGLSNLENICREAIALVEKEERTEYPVKRSIGFLQLMGYGTDTLLRTIMNRESSGRINRELLRLLDIDIESSQAFSRFYTLFARHALEHLSSFRSDSRVYTQHIHDALDSCSWEGANSFIERAFTTYTGTRSEEVARDYKALSDELLKKEREVKKRIRTLSPADLNSSLLERFVDEEVNKNLSAIPGIKESRSRPSKKQIADAVYAYSKGEGYSRGDIVEIVLMAGEDIFEPDGQYLFGGTEEDVKLGSKGEIESVDDASITVRIRNRQYRFAPEEIKLHRRSEMRAMFESPGRAKEYVESLFSTAREDATKRLLDHTREEIESDFRRYREEKLRAFRRSNKIDDSAMEKLEKGMIPGISVDRDLLKAYKLNADLPIYVADRLGRIINLDIENDSIRTFEDMEIPVFLSQISNSEVDPQARAREVLSKVAEVLSNKLISLSGSYNSLRGRVATKRIHKDLENRGDYMKRLMLYADKSIFPEGFPEVPLDEENKDSVVLPGGDSRGYFTYPFVGGDKGNVGVTEYLQTADNIREKARFEDHIRSVFIAGKDPFARPSEVLKNLIRETRRKYDRVLNRGRMGTTCTPHSIREHPVEYLKEFLYEYDMNSLYMAVPTFEESFLPLFGVGSKSELEDSLDRFSLFHSTLVTYPGIGGKRYEVKHAESIVANMNSRDFRELHFHFLEIPDCRYTEAMAEDRKNRPLSEKEALKQILYVAENLDRSKTLNIRFPNALEEGRMIFPIDDSNRDTLIRDIRSLL